MFLSLFFLFFLPVYAQESSSDYYSHHWWGKLPEGKKILIHELFIISFDEEKNLAQWVAYQLNPGLMWGELKSARKYKSDPLTDGRLSPKDYTGASNCDKRWAGGSKRGAIPSNKAVKGYDKGHLAPVGSFKNSLFAYQAQYMTNIVPQSRNLNQGPWHKLEKHIRDFVKTGKEVKILTGPLYETAIAPCWKKAQGKLTQIPTHYWKLVSFKKKSRIHICSVIMPQEVNKNAKPKKFVQSLEKIEKKTQLSLLEKSLNPKIKESCDFLW